MAVKRIGVIGSGQLGRMMAIDAAHLDTEFVFFDEAVKSPCSNLGETIQPSSQDSLQHFINSVDVVTYESENTDAQLVKEINQSVPVYPGVSSLLNSQHRLTEKSFFQSIGIKTADFRKVTTKEELDLATKELGLPIILKTTREGYDGKGQALIRTQADVSSAWAELGDKELIAEAFVTFTRELSVIAARSVSGEIKIYPLAENDHSAGILRVSRVPAQNITPEKQEQAKGFITTLLEKLDHVGVLTLELFDTETGLVANEMAPRVHNSGHWSIEGAYCSQFENHIRAICDLPLGDTQARQPFAGMINIIGKHGDRNLVLTQTNCFYHAYGKDERLNRKIGHINIIANSEQELESSIANLTDFISECGD
ncbi:5-(carboxyamino)imidazole ribonucleotide synthase [Bermanella sp. WJH001]|uniref:5-(carboxyamino)imidazole ribonucleotide synthase n=1 Tax=Bermanella sp. WJH001 TaxID=3048005 RepID=UPI0024BDEED7|nr:5-(carboxyamino)imidazole ribonucleotide synthase [Bermanella sp. WJH001]MDJ1537078.1 5-(carboxyamino)imidazole ribonucleotide synthase [Bermanella sp. WJH001]